MRAFANECCMWWSEEEADWELSSTPLFGVLDFRNGASEGRWNIESGILHSNRIVERLRGLDVVQIKPAFNSSRGMFK